MSYSDLDSEKALISVLLQNSDNMALIPDLRAEHFSEPFISSVFAACYKEFAQNGRYTPASLIPHLWFEKDDSQGLKSLQEISKWRVAILYDVHELAESIRSFYLKRKFEEFISEFAHRAVNELPQDLILEIHSRTENLLTEHSAVKTKTSAEVYEDFAKSLDESLTIYPTGLPAIDYCMAGGLVAGKAYGIAARKKSGKTAFMCTLAQNLNNSGISTLYVALEMGSREMMQRIVARELMEYPQAFLGDKRKEPAFQNKVTAYLSKAPRNLNFIDRAGISFDELKIAMQIGVVKHKAKVVIVDYWQLVGGKSNKKSTAEHLDEVAQWLAEFAKRHRVALLCASQINQEGNTRGGEGMRLAFDQVYQLHRLEDEGEPRIWIEMMDTRYTAWQNIGSKESPAFKINSKGVYFDSLQK